MASYGYGYGASVSQAYSTVQPQGSYQTQPSASGYNQTQSSTGYTGQNQYTNQRAVVQQGYNVAGAYASSNYGYGRQQDATNVQSTQGSYGQTGYVTRDTSYDSTKQSYYPSSSQGSSSSYGYSSPSVKQQSYQTAVGASYSNASQSMGVEKQSYSSYSSQPSNSPASATGYNNPRGQTGSWDTGYATPSAQAQQSTPQRNRTGNQAQVQNAYEPVVYNAATSFLQQQSQTPKPQWQRQPKPQFRFQGNRRGPGSTFSPRPEQLHYCEVCKISCGGPQTYKEHLEGQKHKKKEAALPAQTNTVVPPGSYRCELCLVTCTGTDAYNAHVKGARHIKTVKLHQKLGKPIPENKAPPAPKTATPSPVAAKIAGPKINFVGGTKLFSTAGGTKEEPSPVTNTATEGSSTTEENPDALEEDGEIVGEDYVQLATDEQGNTMQGFKCSLCECRFNDDVARTAHLKGRRHRLNYKKKVQPSLKVDMKGNRRLSRPQEDRLKRAKDNELVWRQRQHEQMHWEQQLHMREQEIRRWEEAEYMKRVGEDRYWTRPDRQRPIEMERYEGGPGQYMGPRGRHSSAPPTPDDRIVMAKHASVYPKDEQLKHIQSAVAATEKGLKLVSDHLSEENGSNGKSNEEAAVNQEGESESGPKPLMQQVEDPEVTNKRSLKGVMRVGVLAKGLLLQQEQTVRLVVLCTKVPTTVLLARVAELLPSKIKEVSKKEEQFDIEVINGQIFVKSQMEPSCTVVVSFTSPVVRELLEAETAETVQEGEATAEKPALPSDALAKDNCLEALASLRHAKWFQAKANGLQSCVIVIRLFRELRNTVAAFSPLTDWMIELLVEKALSSCFKTLPPGEAFRRVLEVISSGLFLPGGSGLADPCEKEYVDTTSPLTLQQREDLTATAQNALRLMAFRRLTNVLSIDASEVFKSRAPKRRLGSDSASDTVAKQPEAEEDTDPDTAKDNEEITSPKAQKRHLDCDSSSEVPAKQPCTGV